LMQHFIEELVRGSMSGVEDTIQRIDVPVTPAKLEPDIKRIASNAPVRRWPVKTMVMTGFYIVAGLGIFGYAGLIGYTNFYRMEVQSAVISAPMETVAAQVDGTVKWTAVKPGDEVKSGEVVVNLVDNELEREIEVAEIAVQERKAQLAYLKRKHTEELDKLRGFATVEMKNVKQSKVELEGLQDQLRLAETTHERLKSLLDKGLATATKVDEAERAIIALRSQVEQRRIELESRVELADQNIGKRLYTGENIVGEASDVEAQVRLAEHEVKLAEQKADTYVRQRQRTSVTAPFDGTVLDLPRLDKGQVRKGETIAIIEQRQDRYVTAYMKQDEVLKIGLNDKVTVFIPALGETIPAHVRGIDRTSGFVAEVGQRQGGDYRWRGSNDRSAKISIEFEDKKKIANSERYRAGLPVVVIFEQRSTNSVIAGLIKTLTGS
jgi:multidrug resistance efflux pump